MHTVRARSIQYPYYFSRISWPHGGPSSIHPSTTVDTEHDLTLNILYYESILILLVVLLYAYTTSQSICILQSIHIVCICRHDVLASIYYHRPGKKISILRSRRPINKQTNHRRVKKYQYLVCILVEQQYAILVCTLHTFVVCIVCILAWCVRSEVHKRKICKLSQLLLQYYNAKNTEQASHVFMTIYMVRIPSFMVRIP